ncbi:rna-directed dna polymerase from mobile element jockey-like [Limosa lapponica baueri]|uniref:Rna-directed dna polymerase from mobile element jockey-like n=1 Tax=Limosa lapponica baueri TaxID=1758121 RepID=A0A2I0U8Z7_LIMLA|nr:rna-directed dna polymerase from mobile element jockey-like [Limosa lapponica baueri]
MSMISVKTDQIPESYTACSFAKAKIYSLVLQPLLLTSLEIEGDLSVGPDGIHSRVLRELEEVFSEPLSIIYQQSWQIGVVPADWCLANVTPIHEKGRKDDPGNYRPVSLTLVPGKVMEQIILSAIMQRMKDTQAIRPSQHGFMRSRSCLTNLISLYVKVTHLVDEGKAVDVVYLDFSKAFDTVSHSILLEKPAAHGLDGSTLHWVKNWLEGWAQRVVDFLNLKVLMYDPRTTQFHFGISFKIYVLAEEGLKAFRYTISSFGYHEDDIYLNGSKKRGKVQKVQVESDYMARQESNPCIWARACCRISLGGGHPELARQSSPEGGPWALRDLRPGLPLLQIASGIVCEEGKLALNEVTVDNNYTNGSQATKLENSIFTSSPCCLEKTVSWFKGIVLKV